MMVDDRMNPEDDVIDAIDALVDEQLTHTPDNYDRPFAESCDLCCHEWHGLPDCPHCDCPGMYATDQQRQAFVKPRPTTARQRAVAVPRRDINLDVPALSDVLVRLWDSQHQLIWSGRVNDIADVPIPTTSETYIIQQVRGDEEWRSITIGSITVGGGGGGGSSAPWGGGGGGRGAPWLPYHDNPWHTPDNLPFDEGGLLDDTTAEYIRLRDPREYLDADNVRCAQCLRHLPGVIIPDGFADVYCADCNLMRNR